MLCTKCSAECVVTLSLAKPGSCVCLDMFLSLDSLVTTALCFRLVRCAVLVLMGEEGGGTVSDLVDPILLLYGCAGGLI
jgi:hypothetical protein